MVVCYIFGKSSDIEEQSDEKSKKVNTLLLTDTFVPERHQPCTETFDKVLLEELKEVMVFGDFKYIVFKEQKYSQKTYHTPFGAISGVALGFGMGILLGMFCLDSGFMGLSLGIAFAVMWGIIFSENDTVKKENKDETDSKK